nr:hypothetical protein [Acidiferrobacterales bacterium]
NGQSSVFEVNNNNRLSLDSVALTNGKRFTGGAIDFRSGAHVSLSNCKLSGNTSYGGGAIYALDATLEVSDCVISDNTASSSTANGGGGYIRNSLARFSRVTFDSNLVTREAYSEGPPSGGGLFVRGGEVTIEDSTFSNNRADGNSFGGYGGALGASSSAVIKLSRTTVSDNFARNNGGGIVGRLGVRSIELTNSTVSGNSAGRSGGGIFQSGSLVLTNSTISANTAANNGGGFFLSLASLTIANSLVAGNKASSLGSELYISSAGLTNSGVNLFGTTGRNSIFGFTPAAKDITVDISSPSRLSQIISPLTNNGGFNFTHALPVGSPAIDMADSSICATTVIDNVDQRGETRDANCDIGAYELTQPASSFFVVPAKNGNTLIFEL